MTFRIHLLACCLLLILACTAKNHLPVDRPSVIEPQPKEEPVPTSPKKVQNSTENQTIEEKLAAKANGQAQLIGDLIDYQGNRISINHFDGKPKILGFWASWCQPCLKEKPYFKALSQQFPEIAFISISIDKKLESSEAYFDKQGISPESFDYWIGYKANQPLHWYNVKPLEGSDGNTSITALPTYILISAEGIILDNDLPKPSSGEMALSVGKLLGM